MKLVESHLNSGKKIAVGDIVIINNNAYMIQHIPKLNEFTAFSLEGDITSTGFYGSIEALECSLRKHPTFRHYPKTEFELVLQPKK